ncbi:hypothetical protein GCM10023085_52750 [Actinomadura viridis]|uniref:Uncharacterized protein n=1 Tax=Actinomadura viridis TaxID=58110 RepID=A0A931DGC7_9ACTN|nr:hypothetical protein [Actinomadura viridis]MBG6086243.1 hypothetical protein [Actinomadura viridis]
MGILLRVLVAAGLAADAYVHWVFAPDMAYVEGGGIGGDALFRAQAVVAALAGLLILAWARWWTYAVAFLVAASAFGAVVLYYFVDVGALGPLPDMYEPVWYGEKTVSAVGEGVAALAALAGLMIARRSRPGAAPADAGDRPNGEGRAEGPAGGPLPERRG